MWPTDATVRASADVFPTDVQVRRLRALELEVRNAAGLPVAGQPIERTSIELEESVST